jgi:hypothetical protein
MLLAVLVIDSISLVVATTNAAEAVIDSDPRSPKIWSSFAAPEGTPTTTTTKKMVLVSTGNLFLVPATPKDMICEIQKIEQLWCRLSWTDTKNRIFSVDYLCQTTPKINFQ